MKHLKLIVCAAVALALLAVPGAAMARSADRDHDRLPDRWERKHNLSTKKRSAARDNDRDGLKNLGEFRSRTDPRDADSDNDGTEDGDEDRDHDGCDNANELRQGTSPRDRDSDDDGKADGREDRDRDGLSNRGEDETANDPIDPDSDDDGTEDGDEHGGVISAFNAETGELTITTTGGESFTGVVNDGTEIECKTEDEHEDEEDDRRGDGTREDRVVAAEDGAHEGESGDGTSGPGSREEHDGDEDNHCTAADLSEGLPVHEAELRLGSPNVWEKVEILK